MKRGLEIEKYGTFPKSAGWGGREIEQMKGQGRNLLAELRIVLRVSHVNIVLLRWLCVSFETDDWHSNRRATLARRIDLFNDCES